MSDINTALVAITKEVKAIGKDSKNEKQNFKFRGIEAVMNYLHPIFAKHGVVILPEVMAERSEDRQTRNGGNLIYRILTIKYRFVCADGSEQYCVVVGEGMDSGDKAANKAMAVALKYALSQMLLLPYDEVDPDSEVHDVAPKPTPAKRTPKQKFMGACKGYKAELGDEVYYRILGLHGFEKANQVGKVAEMKVIANDMKTQIEESK